MLGNIINFENYFLKMLIQTSIFVPTIIIISFPNRYIVRESMVETSTRDKVDEVTTCNLNFLGLVVMKS
jgi:hypothetical protein